MKTAFLWLVILTASLSIFASSYLWSEAVEVHFTLFAIFAALFWAFLSWVKDAKLTPPRDTD